MLKKTKIIFKMVLFLAFFISNLSYAENLNSSTSDYMRVKKDSKGDLVSLEVSLVKYGSSSLYKGVEVDLVSAVHVGEKKYYKDLNELFSNYDVVLYELVAPKEHLELLGPKENRNSLLSAPHYIIKELLGLSFQLEEINYEAKNFIHADLTPSEFLKDMEERGDSFLSVFLELFKASLKVQDNSGLNSPYWPLLLLSSDDPETKTIKLRRLFAKELKKSDFLLDSFNQGSTILTSRNDRVIEVLKRQIKKGKKNIAIFYGAGHMSDLGLKLEKDLGFKRKDISWIEAWNLRVK